MRESASCPVSCRHQHYQGSCRIPLHLSKEIKEVVRITATAMKSSLFVLVAHILGATHGMVSSGWLSSPSTFDANASYIPPQSHHRTQVSACRARLDIGCGTVAAAIKSVCQARADQNDVRRTPTAHTVTQAKSHR